MNSIADACVHKIISYCNHLEASVCSMLLKLSIVKRELFVPIDQYATNGYDNVTETIEIMYSNSPLTECGLASGNILTWPDAESPNACISASRSRHAQ